MLPVGDCSFGRVERAIDRIAAAAPGLKRRFLGAATLCAAADGTVTEKEAELLRALAAAIDAPIPDVLLPAFPSAGT